MGNFTYNNGYLAHKSKYSGGFVSVNGRTNNSSAYNHDYYIHNRNKWDDEEGSESEWGEGVEEISESGLFGKKVQSPDRATPSIFDVRYSDGTYATRNKDGSITAWETNKRLDLSTTHKYNTAKHHQHRNTTNKANQEAKEKGLISNNQEVRWCNDHWSVVTTYSSMGDFQESRKAKHSDIYSNELYHHGILGMKWGVRRFQNKDGSLTPAGQKRKKSLLKYETRPSNRSTSIINNEKSRAQTVAESRKEAAATVKFYGGKNVAKRATEEEYRNVDRKNAIRYGVKGTLSIGASAVGAILAEEGAYTIGALMMGGGAGALAITTIGAYNAARILNHNKNMKVDYINDINVKVPKVDDDDER